MLRYGDAVILEMNDKESVVDVAATFAVKQNKSMRG